MAGYRSFLFPEAELAEDFALLDARESHHLIRVLRATVGTEVELLDGRGRSFRGRLVDADRKRARVAIECVLEQKLELPAVNLVQAIPKGKAMDLILRMATEIGVQSIQPIFTAQGEVQLSGDRLAGKLEKWRLLMIEACKQCGLLWLPELQAPLAFDAWLKSRSSGDQKLQMVASLGVHRQAIQAVLNEGLSDLSTIEIAVGPEGDFSEEEYAGFEAAKWRSVRLGKNILRAETATAYVLSVIDQAKGA
ncbi:MAG: Ribosomal RNA small subunit methyltransferase E [Opitutia bacterium UBA7350]|nr:MAG: Ribosomal RNA small subunit methyltransferase E [Opitutae bacterium UBA7350]